MDCASVLKRGYLVDKKASRLDRKKWYVLRQDINQGYCLLEFYRDEKSAIKGDTPKGFLNVLDVVEVERLREKKQSFELLCPGVAHRFMANSEAEADEWADSIRQLISYRRGDFRSLSLPRVSSSPGFSAPMSTTLPFTRQLTPISNSPPMNITIPTSSHTLVIPHHHSIRPDPFTLSPSPSQITSFTLVPNSFHTSQDTMLPSSTMPAQQIHPVAAQRQMSTDSGNSFPSPPSSSDSSSMCSGSNASFDSASVMDGDNDSNTKSKFRIHLKENEKLGVSGPCDLIVSDDNLTLCCIKTGQVLVSWRIGVLRRYGVNNVCFTFDTGKNCKTGEATFFLYSPQSRLIHAKIHAAAQRLNFNKERRRASAPDPVNKTVPISYQLTPTPSIVSSPPGYSHIEHNLKPSTSVEPYEKLNKLLPSASTTVTTSAEYNTLVHNTPLNYPKTPSIQYATLSYSSNHPHSTSPPQNAALLFSHMSLSSSSLSSSSPHYGNIPTSTDNTLQLHSPTKFTSSRQDSEVSSVSSQREKGPIPHLPSRHSKITSI